MDEKTLAELIKRLAVADSMLELMIERAGRDWAGNLYLNDALAVRRNVQMAADLAASRATVNTQTGGEG